MQHYVAFHLGLHYLRIWESLIYKLLNNNGSGETACMCRLMLAVSYVISIDTGCNVLCFIGQLFSDFTKKYFNGCCDECCSAQCGYCI